MVMKQRTKPDGQAVINNIGLIIVSDMLLTGWDAPIVSTLYLDKPLKEHTLLQAIARVNRTRKGKKQVISSITTVLLNTRMKRSKFMVAMFCLNKSGPM